MVWRRPGLQPLRLPTRSATSSMSARRFEAVPPLPVGSACSALLCQARRAPRLRSLGTNRSAGQRACQNFERLAFLLGFQVSDVGVARIEQSRGWLLQLRDGGVQKRSNVSRRGVAVKGSFDSGTHNPLVVGSSPTRPTTHAGAPVSARYVLAEPGGRPFGIPPPDGVPCPRDCQPINGSPQCVSLPRRLAHGDH